MVAEVTLTKDRIMQLDGNDLNWLLAVHLFGWREIVEEAEIARLNSRVQIAPNKWYISPGGERRYYPCAWSCNWNGTGIVVERMRAEGWNMDLMSAYSSAPGIPFQWGCSFAQKNVPCEGYGLTAPLAVARAALVAITGAE